MSTLLYGLIAGILFGFFLQKARVIRYDKQLAALRLLDMTIVKFMLSSILVSMVGVYVLLDLELIQLSVKPTILGGNVLGGLIFGVGWGLIGYLSRYCHGGSGRGAMGRVKRYLWNARGGSPVCRSLSKPSGNGSDMG